MTIIISIKNSNNDDNSDILINNDSSHNSSNNCNNVTYMKSINYGTVELTNLAYLLRY